MSTDLCIFTLESIIDYYNAASSPFGLAKIRGDNHGSTALRVNNSYKN